jgi:hypothetical protein
MAVTASYCGLLKRPDKREATKLRQLNTLVPQMVDSLEQTASDNQPFNECGDELLCVGRILCVIDYPAQEVKE